MSRIYPRLQNRRAWSRGTSCIAYFYFFPGCRNDRIPHSSFPDTQPCAAAGRLAKTYAADLQMSMNSGLREAPPTRKPSMSAAWAV